MASDSIDEVHRSFFSRDDKHLCHALMLIDPTAPREGVGRLYRLRQGIGFGMELEVKREYNSITAEATKQTERCCQCRSRSVKVLEESSARPKRPVQPSGLRYQPGPSTTRRKEMGQEHSGRNPPPAYQGEALSCIGWTV